MKYMEMAALLRTSVQGSNDVNGDLHVWAAPTYYVLDTDKIANLWIHHWWSTMLQLKQIK